MGGVISLFRLVLLFWSSERHGQNRVLSNNEYLNSTLDGSYANASKLVVWLVYKSVY